MTIRKIKSLKIGSVRYDIVRAEKIVDSDNALGAVTYSAGEIGICTKQTSEDVEITTIMHEALHALYWHAGVKNHKEEVIEVISGMLIRFIQDNPKFIEAVQLRK